MNVICSVKTVPFSVHYGTDVFKVINSDITYYVDGTPQRQSMLLMQCCFLPQTTLQE